MMRSHNWTRATLFGLFLVAFAVPSGAQDLPRGEFSAGWRLLHLEEETLAAGWYTDVAGNLNERLAIVGEVAGAYKSIEETQSVSGVTVTATGDLSVHTFMGGVRLSARQNPRVVPFGQVLVGGVRGSTTIEGSATVAGRTFTVSESDSSTEFGLELGGGVNISAGDRLRVRVAASFLRVFAEGAGSNAFSLGAGIVVPF